MSAQRPWIVINFKAYREATAENAVKLSLIVEKTAKAFPVRLVVAPQLCDISRVASRVIIPVFAQHVDEYPQGAYTGHVIAESIKLAGASGSLINHSEHLLNIETIKKCIQRCRDAGIKSLVCAHDAPTAAQLSTFQPDMLAVEPPELIGSGISVSTARPELLEATVKQVREVNKNVPILCGAGITSGKDVEAAAKLGMHGILVASGIVKSAEPEKTIRDMARAAVRGSA